jgi:hypothetical protein
MAQHDSTLGGIKISLDDLDVVKVSVTLDGGGLVLG